MRTIGTFQSVQEIAELPIGQSGLRLRDVADVSFTEPPLEYGRHLDGQFAIGISVNKEANANTVTICDEVVKRVEKMKDDPEHAGINFLVWDNQGREIRRTMGDLRNTGILGAILASLVLYAFLRRLSTTIVADICIPFSLTATCAVIFLQGKSLNTLSLLGLIVGIGMLVDNAVVVMENIFRYQNKGLSARIASWLPWHSLKTTRTIGVGLKRTKMELYGCQSGEINPEAWFDLNCPRRVLRNNLDLNSVSHDVIGYTGPSPVVPMLYWKPSRD